MDIRPAREDDIPGVVGLLKRSLGEGLMPKSEEFWRWKHVDNPFGPSPVLVALEGERIIGVRAFLRWEWTRKQELFRAVRAVDTATDPDFQGRGIFSKLTLNLVDTCKHEGIDFVFNTPNDQSKPGYLKMGWKDAGKLAVTIGYPLAVHRHTMNSSEIPLGEMMSYPGMEALVNLKSHQGNFLITRFSVRYLRWRYLDCTTIDYYCLNDFAGEASFAVIYRIKR